jgi:hypothetical protein
MVRLPPYGRDVAKNPQNVFIYAGDNAWTAGRIRAGVVGKNSLLVLPPGEDYQTYRWPVQGVPLLLVWPDGELNEVKAFVAYLIQQGSPHVIAPHPDDPEGCIYAKPRRAAA